MIGPGSTVGSYRLIKQIGTGGMGVVFEATHVMLARRVAIKVLRPELLSCPGMASRMAQEASILEELHHPGSVKIFDCGVLEDHCPWIAMELITGESLTVRLARELRLLPLDVCKLVAALADVLAAAHAQGIVHRDLKPDNVLLADADRVVQIIVWGVARLGPTARFTLDGRTYGTPSYMSPEQIVGRDIASPCDIYSVGVIAYEALAGRVPFDGTSLVEVVALHLHGNVPPLAPQCPAAPRALCELVHRMLDKVPSQRPTAVELRDSMRVIASQLTTCDCEFELFELTASVPDIQISARVRWTPNLSSLPAILAYTRPPPPDSWAVAGEILRCH
jgi:serine/threonine protein kinase